MKQVEYTKAKISSMLRLIESVKTKELPHSHAQAVLDHIESLFNKRISLLSSILPTTDQLVANSLCKEALAKLAHLFPLVGFIERSMDVRNAFEIHGPLLRLVKKVLGPQAKLIISSEWQFSPFTYKMPQDFGFNDVVFIGVPASESNNSLVIPLSGHELGHNIWRACDLFDAYKSVVEDELLRIIRGEEWGNFVKQFPEIGDKSKLNDMIGRQIWTEAWKWTMSQCEETFCDVVGLLIFREAYLDAFAYLLAPGLPGIRSVQYPSIEDRIAALEQAAKIHGIDVANQYSGLFEQSDPPRNASIRVLLEISDKTTKSLLGKLLQEATEILSSRKLTSSSEEEVKEITRSFAIGVPATSATSICNIVNAAWKYYRLGMIDWEKNYPKIYRDQRRREQMLDDLVFKSIEVLEIDQIQSLP